MGLDNKPNSLGTVTVLDWITIMKAFGMAAPPGHGHLQWRHLVAYAVPWGMSLNLPQSCFSFLEEGRWAPMATVRR